MDKNYEYHKQNDYPGERAAEKKRVADREEAAGKLSGLSSVIIAVLMVVMIAGFSLSYITTQNQEKEIDALNMQIKAYGDAEKITSPSAENVQFAADTSPTIFRVSPANNELGVSTNETITVWFSEPMDTNTINENTFIVYQRTTPIAGLALSEYRSMKIEGTINSDGLIATFIPNKTLSHNPLQPNQQYGNVFTVNLTKELKNLEGTALKQNYVWSFTTGNAKFNTGNTTSQTG